MRLDKIFNRTAALLKFCKILVRRILRGPCRGKKSFIILKWFLDF